MRSLKTKSRFPLPELKLDTSLGPVAFRLFGHFVVLVRFGFCNFQMQCIKGELAQSQSLFTGVGE